MELINFLCVVLDLSTPILFAALGVLLIQLSGVVNIGAEGMMLMGAFFAVLGSSLGGDVWFGTLFVIIILGIVGALFAFFTVTMKANQVVVGVAFNIFAGGFTTTLNRVIFGMSQSTTKVDTYEKLFIFSAPVYISVLLVFIFSILFYKTKIGLEIRGTGEYPKAIDSVGISVTKIRYLSIIVGSMLIGIGGAYLSVGQLSFFTENMVTGRGFIALAAVILGRYTPIGTWLAVLVFGAGEALVYTVQATGSSIPSHLILMLPYIITMIAVTMFGQKSAGPASIGIPFTKDSK